VPQKKNKAVRNSVIIEPLKTAITDTGVSFMETARQSGVAHPIISRFMSGERGMSISSADALAEHLGLVLVSIDSLPPDHLARKTKNTTSK
jgi:transcriptional regulator with XRE-family HTH domain